MRDKPHIHYRRGRWLCGRPGTFIQGDGSTPHEAYANYGYWLRNHLAATANIHHPVAVIQMSASRRSWWDDLCSVFGG